MKKDGLQRMLDFLNFLQEKGIEPKIEHQVPDSLMVTFALVGIRVEVDFDVDFMQFSLFKGDEAVQMDEKVLIALIEERVR